MVSSKVTSLTLAAMVAAGSCTAAAFTLTPGTALAQSTQKQSVMPRAPSSKSPMAKSPMATPTTSCHPTTAKGHCYEPGEYCRKSDLGKSGVAGDGAKITCKYTDGRYRWARA